MIESLYVLIMTAIACSVIGVFLVLRNLAMISDAISHSVLLGIVVAYFITKDITSIYLIIGAAVFGVLTCACIEILAKTKLITEDASVGIIFPLFFSLAVILITRYARNVHIDTDIVLMGEIILVPFTRFKLSFIDIPRSMFIMIVVFVANMLFILINFRKLKISTFDNVFAGAIGISTGILYYTFMGMVSLTAVASFESVGAILTISFFIAPAASAYLITKDLKMTILVSIIYAIINSYIGFHLAVALNVSISGMCATVSGLTFLCTVLFYPKGIVTDLISRRRKNRRFNKEMLVLHIGNHRNSEDRYKELGISTMKDHVKWSGYKFNHYVKELINEGYIYENSKDNIYDLTEAGWQLKEKISTDYGLM